MEEVADGRSHGVSTSTDPFKIRSYCKNNTFFALSKISNFSKIPHKQRALIWEMLEGLHGEFEVEMLFDANLRIGTIGQGITNGTVVENRLVNFPQSLFSRLAVNHLVQGDVCKIEEPMLPCKLLLRNILLQNQVNYSSLKSLCAYEVEG